MKKVFFIAVIIFAAHYAQAQITASSKKQEKKEKKADKKDMRQVRKDIRASSKAGFAKDFAGITEVSWTTDSVYDVAGFISKGEHIKAYYDETGTLAGTLTYVSFTSLPEKSRKQIKKDYKNYNVTEAISYVDNASNSNDLFLYRTKLKHDNYLVAISDGTDDVMLLVTRSGNIIYLYTI